MTQARERPPARNRATRERNQILGILTYLIFLGPSGTTTIVIFLDAIAFLRFEVSGRKSDIPRRSPFQIQAKQQKVSQG
jgi:hypothetical protein